MEFRQEQGFFFTQTMAQRLSILQMGAAKLSLLVEKEAQTNPLIDASKIPAPWNRGSVPADISDSIAQERRLYDRVREDLILDWEEGDGDLLHLIIGSLDPHGFLGMDGRELCLGTPFDGERTEYLRLKILDGSLPGLAAINAKEYYVYGAREIFGEGSPPHLCALALNQSKKTLGIRELASTLEQSEEWVRSALGRLRTLSPSPLGEEASAVIPDFIVRVDHGALSISLTRSLRPRVNIIEDSTHSAEEMQGFQRRAQAIIEGIRSREEALLRHAEALILARSDFFMKDSPPSVVRLKEISKITGRHMSTVSRALKGRYFLFEGAIYPFSLLWSHSVRGKSHRMIEERIRTVLANEDKKQPFSDEDIGIILGKQGLDVARRTIAKYREKMGIPGMHQRKQGGTS